MYAGLSELRRNQCKLLMRSNRIECLKQELKNWVNKEDLSKSNIVVKQSLIIL